MKEKSLIELAREIGISYQRIYTKVWEGKLKARKVAGRWMICEAEEARFISERKDRLGG